MHPEFFLSLPIQIQDCKVFNFIHLTSAFLSPMQKLLVLKDTDIILHSLYLAMCTQCPHNDRTNTLPTMWLLKLILIQKNIQSKSYILKSLEVAPLSMIMLPTGYICKFSSASHFSSQSLTFLIYKTGIGLPWWLSGKESTCQCRRHGFDPWVRKIPWRRKWQPTPAFLPGESHGQRSLAGYSPWGPKESDTT